MTYSSACGTIVRTSRRNRGVGSNPNGRKEWIVIRRDIYVGALKMWRPTLPITIKQACEAFEHFNRWDETEVKMITVKEWEQMKKQMKINEKFN
jgi:hypothetical protein